MIHVKFGPLILSFCSFECLIERTDIHAEMIAIIAGVMIVGETITIEETTTDPTGTERIDGMTDEEMKDVLTVGDHRPVVGVEDHLLRSVEGLDRELLINQKHQRFAIFESIVMSAEKLQLSF